jgi:hypothetical protein
MRGVRVAVLVTVMGVLAFGLLASPAPAVTTWSGSCTYEGWSQFWPYRKWVPEPAGYYYQGKGPCKGTLNGAPFDGQGTIDLYANMKQPMGCSAGGSTYGGPVYMTFLTGAGNRAPVSATTTTRPSSRPKPHAKKRKHRSHRKQRKRARRAAVRAAASNPPSDPDQAAPRPPAPNTADPMLTAWTDEVNTANYITSDWYGNYRGFGTGFGTLASDTESLKQCGADGIPGTTLKSTYTTTTEMRG